MQDGDGDGDVVGACGGQVEGEAGFFKFRPVLPLCGSLQLDSPLIDVVVL